MAFVERGRSTEHLMGSGDRHEATGWTAVCALEDIEPGRGVVRVVNGLDLALMRDGDGSPDDAVYALGNLCPHRGGQIGDGRVVDGKAICPLHTWDFDLRTGVSPFNPADSLPTFPARVRDGQVEVDASAVPLTAPRPPVYLGPWIRRGAEDRGMYLVHHLAEGAGAFVEAMGSERNEPGHDTGRRYPSYDDLVFRPGQVSQLPTLGEVPIDTSVVLGARAAKPLRLDLPVFVSHMSFGALSAEAKEALARGSAAAGTAIASGEGGAHPRERDNAAHYIFEMASGYFGWTEENITAADAIEIKIGQGAKPGLGGTLLGPKVTDEIAAIRGVPVGEDCVSPPYHREFSDVDGLIDLVERIAGATGLPVGIKSAVGEQRFWDDLVARMAERGEGPDFVTIDGGEGGSGAAPLVFADHVSLPFRIGFPRVYRTFAAAGLADDVVFVGSGKLGLPGSGLMAMALGCDLVNVGREALLSIGCIQAQRCHTGRCPTGVATQVPWLVRGLDPDLKSVRCANYVVALRRELLRLARACGQPHPGYVDLDHLEFVEDPTLSRSARERFGYAAGWGVPTGPPDVPVLVRPGAH